MTQNQCEWPGRVETIISFFVVQVHVKAHVGIYGDEKADQLAKEGSKSYKLYIPEILYIHNLYLSCILHDKYFLV